MLVSRMYTTNNRWRHWERFSPFILPFYALKTCCDRYSTNLETFLAYLFIAVFSAVIDLLLYLKRNQNSPNRLWFFGRYCRLDKSKHQALTQCKQDNKSIRNLHLFKIAIFMTFFPDKLLKYDRTFIYTPEILGLRRWHVEFLRKHDLSLNVFVIFFLDGKKINKWGR